MNQSKSILKQVRVEPEIADQIGKTCFRYDVSFSDFARAAFRLACVYYPYVNILLDRGFKDEVVSIITAAHVQNNNPE